MILCLMLLQKSNMGSQPLVRMTIAKQCPITCIGIDKRLV